MYGDFNAITCNNDATSHRLGSGPSHDKVWHSMRNFEGFGKNCPSFKEAWVKFHFGGDITQ